MGADYKVRYAKGVLEFMRTEIQTRKAYERVDSYRTILASFPEAGAVYDPTTRLRARQLNAVTSRFPGLPSRCITQWT